MMNVQKKNTYSHTLKHEKSQYDARYMFIRQKSKCRHSKHAYIAATDHGPNRCTVIKAFLYMKKKTFNGLKEGKEEKKTLSKHVDSSR